MEGKLGDKHAGQLRFETAEARVNRILVPPRLYCAGAMHCAFGCLLGKLRTETHGDCTGHPVE